MWMTDGSRVRSFGLIVTVWLELLGLSWRLALRKNKYHLLFPSPPPFRPTTDEGAVSAIPGTNDIR
jgi:hypothetical protein